ncbi:MAG: hypothetical protein Q8K58_08165 [Acidimicrobiales bacterium]|nr:hypothetical protein [Acidimicrobiales bacterium]
MATETNKGDRSKPVWGDGGETKKATPAKKAPASSRKGGAAKKASPAKRSKPAKKASAAAARRQTGSSARMRRLRQRYVPVHDTDGPRVRLGILWFLLAFLALVIGGVPTAFVYGVAAAIAGAQTARAWRKRKLARPSELMAAGGAGLIAVGACFGAGGAGLGILGCVVVAYVGVQGDSGSPNARIADMGMTLQCALPVGIVALSMVLLTRLDRGSAVALLLLVSAYETGDFLIGAGAANPYEGPAAGVASIVVITFILSTLPISTLSFGEAWLFGGLVAVLAPAGEWLGSALLPSAGSPASALRRLDSLLITAPLWAWGVGLVLQG